MKTQITPIKRLGIIFVFGIVAFLFWKNYEHVYDKILYQKIIEDETNSLTKKQKDLIRKFSRMVKGDYGIVVKVKVYKNKIKIPSINVKTLFIGICPATKEFIVIFPPLLKKALSKDFVNYMQKDHFALYLKKNQWQKGLMKSLLLLWENLSTSAGG